MNLNKVKYNKLKLEDLITRYQTKHKGETQISIAKKIGISKSTVSHENPTVETLSKAATFFGVDMNYFFDIPSTVTSAPREDYSLKKGATGEIYKALYKQQDQITEITSQLTELKNMIANLGSVKD